MKTHYKTLLENEHLGQWDLIDPKSGDTKRATVVIAAVSQYVPQQRRKKRMPDGSYAEERANKLVIAFVGKRKKWICGPTNQQTIAGIYGPYLEDWKGKKVTLYVDSNVTMGRRVVGGIRVENTAPREEPTEDKLDNEIDAERRALIDEAFAETEGT